MWADLPRGTAQTGGHRGPLRLGPLTLGCGKRLGVGGASGPRGLGVVSDLMWGLRSRAPSDMVSVGGSAPPWLGGLFSSGGAEVGGDAPRLEGPEEVKGEREGGQEPLGKCRRAGQG